MSAKLNVAAASGSLPENVNYAVKSGFPEEGPELYFKCQRIV